MDTTPTTQNESPSKLGLILGAVGIALGIAGCAMGWMGMQSAKDLQMEVDVYSSFPSKMRDMSDSVETLSKGQVKSSDLNTMATKVNRAIKGVSGDVASLKRDLKRALVQSDTSLKKVAKLERDLAELKKAGISAPAKRTTKVSTTTKKKDSSATVKRLPGKDFIHVIQKGDYLGKLASKYGVSLQAIYNANPGVDPLSLAIGQDIVIPGK